MINFKKNILNFNKFTEYVGVYCGYEDYHVLDKLDDLTSKSLITNRKEIENRNFINYPYYENLERHICRVLESIKK